MGLVQVPLLAPHHVGRLLTRGTLKGCSLTLTAMNMNFSISLFWVQCRSPLGDNGDTVDTAPQHLPPTPKYWIETMGRNYMGYVSSLVLLFMGSFLMKKKNVPRMVFSMQWNLELVSVVHIWLVNTISPSTSSRMERRLPQFHLGEQSKGQLLTFTPKSKHLEEKQSNKQKPAMPRKLLKTC